MKKWFISFSILVFLLTIPIKAEGYNIPLSNIYQQGIYSVESGVGEYNATVKLVSGKETSLIVVNGDNDITAYIKLPLNKNVVLEKINNKHKIIIIGDGNVAISYEKA